MDSLLLHRSFLCTLRVHGGQLTGVKVGEAALKAKLACVQDLIHTIHATIQAALRLLALPPPARGGGGENGAGENGSGEGEDWRRQPPREIALERCRSRLLCIARVGLLGVWDKEESVKVIAKVSEWLEQHPPSEDLLLARLEALNDYVRRCKHKGGEGAGAGSEAADRAALLMRSCILPALRGSRARRLVRICTSVAVSSVDMTQRILAVLRATTEAPCAHLVRNEPLCFPPALPSNSGGERGARGGSGGGGRGVVCYVACGGAEAEALQAALQASLEASLALPPDKLAVQLVAKAPQVLALALTPAAAAMSASRHDFGMALTWHLSLLVRDLRLHCHCIAISRARTQALVELYEVPTGGSGEMLGSAAPAQAVDEALKALRAAAGELIGGVRIRTVCFLRPRAAAAGGEWWCLPRAGYGMAHGGGGGGLAGGASPSVSVSSNVSDFTAEREALSEWVLPGVQEEELTRHSPEQSVRYL